MFGAFNKKLASLSGMPEKKRKRAVENAPESAVKLPKAAQEVLLEKLADQAAKQAGSKVTTYFMPKSLTWWAGVGAIAIGIVPGVFPALKGVEVLGEVINYMTDGNAATPGQFIVLGLSVIGIRAKMSRLI